MRGARPVGPPVVHDLAADLRVFAATVRDRETRTGWDAGLLRVLELAATAVEERNALERKVAFLVELVERELEGPMADLEKR